MAAMTKTEQALKLVRQMQVVRPKDLLPYGIAPVYLRRLIKTGELTQTARSLYKLPEHKKTTSSSHFGWSDQGLGGGLRVQDAGEGGNGRLV